MPVTALVRWERSAEVRVPARKGRGKGPGCSRVYLLCRHEYGLKQGLVAQTFRAGREL